MTSVQEAIRRAHAILPGIPAPEGEEDVRWQAIIEIGCHIESNPDEIWEFVARWGCHPQDDLRAAIGTCLLEHLLQYHFDLIFPRVRTLAESNRLFSDTFSSCWKHGQAELPANSKKWDALRKSCRSKWETCIGKTI